MLQVLDNKTVQGPGFRVTVPNIHKVVYSEPERTADVEIEGGAVGDGVDWLVYSKTITGWQSTGCPVEMTETESGVVLRRISECLRLLNMPHRLA